MEMNKNVKAFVEKVATDKELLAKLSAVKSPDEAFELAKSVQGGFTKEEFIADMRKLKEAAANRELSDDDVAEVAGGGDLLDITASILSVIESAMALAG